MPIHQHRSFISLLNIINWRKSNKKFYRTKGDINGLHSSVTSRVRGGFSSVMTLGGILRENNNMPTHFESAARLLSCTRIYKRNLREVCFESIYGIVLAGMQWFPRCWSENPIFIGFRLGPR